MQRQNEVVQEQKSIIATILNYKENPESIEEQVIKTLLVRSSCKVQEEIMHGDINVFDPYKVLQEVENIKAERRKREMELERVNIAEEEERFKQLKREIIKLKKQQVELARKQKEIKSKTIIEKVKKWEEMQEQIKAKKISIEKERQKQLAQELIRQKEEEEYRQKAKKEEKKRHIGDKLKQIEDTRRKRQEIIKFAQYEYSKLNPKYLQIEKKFKQMEEEVKFQKDIYKKNHKISQRIDHESIKNHEKIYMTQVKERIMKRNILENVSQEPFTPFVCRDEEKISQEKQKLKRRKEFQQKLKKLPVATSEEKKIEIQIARDKGKNPLKYHFLSQKALNEEKIYEQFKDFQMNINPRQLGKEYLKQLSSITQHSRIAKSQSLSSLGENKDLEKSRYRDYLQEMKSERRDKGIKTDEQILLLKHTDNRHKTRFLDQLDERSRRYDIELKRRKQQLAGYNGFQSTIKKVKEMDQVYVKSIQAKLACLQLNS